MIHDWLRPPPPIDPDAAAYKDWLHLNVFDHASGTVMLFNTSLHGAPFDGRARVIGTAMVHQPGVGWSGNMSVSGFGEAVIGSTSIATEGVALAVEPQDGGVLVSAAFPEDALEASISTRRDSSPIAVEERLPFGSGWISWYAVPRLTVTGRVTVAGRSLDLAGASAYHDHNWGRWHWGDDAGWEWGACLATGSGPTFVFSRTSSRDHRRHGPLTLHLQHGAMRRRWTGDSVRIELAGRSALTLRRLPGSLAALHQDRVQPALPDRVTVHARDGVDRLDLEFRPDGGAQLIAADPTHRGYGFVHELVGRFTAEATIAGRVHRASGLGVFEFVD
jgi:hypothetical protein